MTQAVTFYAPQPSQLQVDGDGDDFVTCQFKITHVLDDYTPQWATVSLVPRLKSRSRTPTRFLWEPLKRPVNPEGEVASGALGLDAQRTT